MRERYLAAIVGLTACLLAGVAQATTIDLGLNGTPGQQGNIGNWKVTAAGAVDQTPYNFGTTALALSSTGYNDGTPVPGASYKNYDGFASFSTSFYLPANATGATLTYTNLEADDRFVFELNGVVLGASGIYAPVGSTYLGSFVYTDGGPKVPTSYMATSASGANGLLSGTATTPFILGGANTLTALVNETYNGVYDNGSPNGLYEGDFKATNFGADAITVSYGVSSVPLPASAPMFGAALLGLAGFGCAAKRKKAAAAA